MTVLKNTLVKTNASQNTDSYTFLNPYGGDWSSASNWTDTTTNTVATVAPGATNAVMIIGGSSAFLNITGTGAAASLAVSNQVLFWGPVTVGGNTLLASNARVDLDGGASLTTNTLNIAYEATLSLVNNSVLTTTALANLASYDDLIVTGSSKATLGSLVVGPASELAVDDNSSIEVGSTGSAALGAVTVDAGQTTAISGTIWGNLVANGTIQVQASGSLSIDPGTDPFGTGSAISGSGVFDISEDSQLTLGVADSAAITFTGPSGTLGLSVLPTSTISGFTTGDFINLASGVATGMTAQLVNSTTETLTLTKGGTTVGMLTLAGNYTGDLFHLSVASNGTASITLQTVGVAPVQPSLITGTVGTDYLYATAANQVLTGLGGGSDAYTGGAFSGITFKDTSADLITSYIYGFATSDVVDLTDMNSATATVSYAPTSLYSLGLSGLVRVTDGTHTASFTINGYTASGIFPVGYFALATDGGSGTKVSYVLLNTDSYTWKNSNGGTYSVASNWTDATLGATATVAPSYGNAVTIAGGSTFTEIMGPGAAASLTTSGDVLLRSSFAVGQTGVGVSGSLSQSGKLALDSGSSLIVGLASSSSVINGEIEIGGGSLLTVAGYTSLSTGAALLAVSGSAIRLTGGSLSSFYNTTIGVDSTSYIEIGSVGSSAKGAVTIDAGITTTLQGVIDGNVVVNGTLTVTNGASLTLLPFGTTSSTVSGSGLIDLEEGTLTISGADSAAIKFDSGTTSYNYYGNRVLNLTGPLPTGTISGFGTSISTYYTNKIVVSQTVTNLSYSQTTATAGTLTLLNGSTNVGTMSLAGIFTASQFEVVLSANQATSTIQYLPSPSTATGNAVSTNSDTYEWMTGAGGDWSNPANWTDENTGATGVSTPGSSNTVYLNNSSSSTQIISGSGAAALLYNEQGTVITGSVIIAGELSNYNTLFIAQNATVTASQLYNSGVTEVSDGTLNLTGSTLYNYIYGSLTAVNSGKITLTGYDNVYGVVAVDSTASVEFGSANSAVAGAVTIDAGTSVYVNTSGTNVGSIDGRLIVNGTYDSEISTITGFGGSVGSVSGSGIIEISGGLVLNATDTAALQFLGTYGLNKLELESSIPTGVISGFSGQAAIQVDKLVTSLSYTQNNSTTGTLTLLNGSSTVGTLSLSGSYSSNTFLLEVAPATGYATITVQSNGGTPGSAAVSTGPDAYRWTSTTAGGDWNTSSNWTDTTTASTPTTVPGAGDAVTINSTAGNSYASNTFLTISGNAAAASLTTTGDVELTGSVAVGGQVSIGSTASPGKLAISQGGKMTASTATVSGALEVSGASTVSLTGVAKLAAGALTLSGGSNVLVSQLNGGGLGNSVTIDATSTLAIGTVAQATAGAMTIEAGASAALTGSIFGSIVAHSTLSVAAGGALAIDFAKGAESDLFQSAPSIGGNGTLQLTENSTLSLGVSDSVAILFSGPNATLELAALPTATISSFAAGDAIKIDQTVTGVAYTQVTSTTSKLTLVNGTTTVGTLNLQGNFGGVGAFHLDSATDGSSATISMQTVGVATTQPTLIQGTFAADQLVATANGQTLTGFGGGDTMSGGGFTGTDFKDLTAHFTGSTLNNFIFSDKIDFTDLTNTKATFTLGSNGQLAVTDGTHAATLNIGFQVFPTGTYTAVADGSGGTLLSWAK